jgi:hypothetical protein
MTKLQTKRLIVKAIRDTFNRYININNETDGF